MESRYDVNPLDRTCIIPPKTTHTFQEHIIHRAHCPIETHNRHNPTSFPHDPLLTGIPPTMSSAIPTSTSVSESAVINAPLAQVWHLIKLQDFHKFWSKLDKSDYVKGVSPETDIVRWTFKDGTVLDVKQEEHSVSYGLLLQ